eukprot:479651_1
MFVNKVRIRILSITCAPFIITDLKPSRTPIIYNLEKKIIMETNANMDANINTNNESEWLGYEFKQNIYEKFMEHKGKISKMETILCDGFDCPKKHIEISKNPNINSLTITLYVIHCIKNNTNVHQIIKLYLEKSQHLKNKFQKHFSINNNDSNDNKEIE